MFFSKRSRRVEESARTTQLSSESLEPRHLLAGVVGDGVPQVDFEVINDWGSGYQGKIDIVNDEPATTNDWVVEFDLAGSIRNLWNGRILEQSGNSDGTTRYTVKSLSWNSKLANGRTASFGFIGKPEGDAPAVSNIVINGVVLTEDGIVDPPPPVVPEIGIEDLRIDEGDNGSQTVRLTVSLSEPTTTEVSVQFATSDGTATSESDYSGIAGELVFAPGQREQTIEIVVLGDTTLESDESFQVSLSSPSGATIAKATATVTIVNNDAPQVVVPDVSVGDISVVEGDLLPVSSGGWFHTEGNQIVDANGTPVQLTGVNWFGLETETAVPHGLWARNWESMMEQMADLGFNTIRLPFSIAGTQPGRMPTSINYSLNPDLQGLTSLEVLDKIVDKAGALGMRMILDNHRAGDGGGPNPGGLWYTNEYSEQDWIDNWVRLAERYADNPVVIGADLQNEPHGGTWGTGDMATDWRLAAERAGNAVLAANPNWLIFVEGVSTTPEAGSYWWGGNLSRAGDYPVRLDVDGRLVYSPHAYPQSVFNQPWFSDPTFPENLPAIWDRMFGYIYQENIAPVYLGEWGASFDPPLDAPWVDTMVQYLSGDFDVNGSNDLAAGNLPISWTWWSWNPNSGDTEGILNPDWTTVDGEKYDRIQGLLSGMLPVNAGPGGSVAERTQVNVAVTLSEATTVPVTVGWQTEELTAVAGSDFESDSGVLTFAPGETQQVITLTILGDVDAEDLETFRISLSDPENASLTDSSATVEIIDNDVVTSLPQLSIGDVQITEGDSGTIVATSSVTLSESSLEAVQVAWATSDDTATSGQDYLAASGTLLFAPGETQQNINVTIFGDTVDEPDEQFSVELLEAAAAEIARRRGIISILDNDEVVDPLPASEVTGEFILSNDWGSGFVAQVKIANNSSEPLTDWTIDFRFDREITNIWNAEIVRREGDRYTIRAASWNRTIPPGGEVTFGFQGRRGGILESPTEVVLNDRPIDLAFMG